MIEINLLPGAAKKQKQRLPALNSPLSSLKLPKLNKAVAGVAAAWVVGLGLAAFLHFSSTRKHHQLEVDVQAAQRDSARLHNLRVLNDSLRGQIDKIGAKLNVLQEIDAGRYIWSHLLDEISRALPQYTWLVNITDAAAEGTLPRVKLEGRTGNTFALAKFMQDLEASPFISNVLIVSQTQTRENEKHVYAFVLEMDYEDPPPDVIDTQPLFNESTLAADTVALPDTAKAAGEGN